MPHEIRYKLALEAVNQGLWDWNLKTNEVYFTPRYYTMLGYKPYEMQPSFETWVSLVHPDDLPDVLEKLNHYLAKEIENYEVEFRLKTKSENWKWILGRGKIVEWDGQGNPVRLIGTHQDIDQRKKNEARTNHLNGVLQAIRNVNQLILREKNRKKIIQGVCDIFVRTCKYKNVWIILQSKSEKLITWAESGLGNDFLPVIEMLSQGEIPFCVQKAKNTAKAIFTEHNFQECKKCPLFHRYKETASVTMPLRYGANDYGILSFSLPEGLSPDSAEQDLVGNVACDIAFALYSLDMEESLIKRTYELGERVKELNCLFGLSVLLEKSDISLDEFFNGVVNLVCSAFQYPDIVCSRIRLADGQEFMTKNFKQTVWGLTSKISSRGEYIGIIEIYYFKAPPTSIKTPFLAEEKILLFSIAERLGNVMEHKAMENMLRIKDKMSSLGRVAAGIAHEIRNPLSGINIYIDTLEQLFKGCKNQDKLQNILERIQSASSKIESIIKRVMDFSKPGEPRFTKIDICKPINEAIQLTNATLKKNNILLQKNLACDLPPCYADAQMIEQVLLNLINNATDAVANFDNKKKIIEITTFAKSKHIYIIVSDSGTGVPSNIINYIFDPFYSTKNFGTGIGLSLCQRIITDHGGTIEISSNKWKGAKFIIKLPIKSINQ